MKLIFIKNDSNVHQNVYKDDPNCHEDDSDYH